MERKKRVALITTEVGKGWIVSDNTLPYIDARGRGYRTAREAIKAAREDGYTHYISRARKDDKEHTL